MSDFGRPRPIDGQQYDELDYAHESEQSAAARAYYSRISNLTDHNGKLVKQVNTAPKRYEKRTTAVDGPETKFQRVYWLGWRSGSMQTLARQGESVSILSVQRGDDYTFSVGRAGYIRSFDLERLKQRYIFQMAPLENE